MTRIIPYELIKHLEWDPGKEMPNSQNSEKPSQPGQQRTFGIDDLVRNGKAFYSNEKEDGNRIGVAVALQQALDYAGENGIIVTMPELIAAKVKADKEHDFWQRGYDVHTEEDIGIDKKGRFYARNNPVLIIVNGGGILTPDRIRQAYSEGLIDNSARYTDEEFNELLEGKLPDGSSLNIYPFDDIKKGVSNLLHKFGVVMPYELAKRTKSGYHKKSGFLENPLVIARNGGRENLEKYYEEAKDSDNDLGNWHVYDNSRDALVPQGRLLFLYDNRSGLDGDDYLGNSGRFVGVAPEARARK